MLLAAIRSVLSILYDQCSCWILGSVLFLQLFAFLLCRYLRLTRYRRSLRRREGLLIRDGVRLTIHGLDDRLLRNTQIYSVYRSLRIGSKSLSCIVARRKPRWSSFQSTKSLLFPRPGIQHFGRWVLTIVQSSLGFESWFIRTTRLLINFWHFTIWEFVLKIGPLFLIKDRKLIWIHFSRVFGKRYIQRLSYFITCIRLTIGTAAVIVLLNCNYHFCSF